MATTRRGSRLAVVLASCLLSGAAHADGRIVVLPLKASGVPADTVQVLDELLLAEVARWSQRSAIGLSDLNTLLGLERMKDVLACDEAACAAEIGGALSAELLVAGNLGLLGGEVVVTLKLVDVRGMGVTARSQESAPGGENAYRETLRKAVARLFGAADARTAPPETVVADFTGPMARRFTLAGLDRNAFLDFSASGLSYPAWRRAYNDKTESLVLEISKWVATGTAILVFGSAAASGRQSVGVAFALSLPLSLSAGGLWALDLANIGNAPEELPSL